MNKTIQTIGGVLLTAGAGGGGVAIYVSSIGSIGHQLSEVEGRTLYKTMSGGSFDEAWKDLESAFNNQYPIGDTRFTEDIGSGDVVLTLSLSEICSAILGWKYWGEEDETYLFARRFCSVGETIGSVEDLKSKLFSGDWETIRLKYHHWVDRMYRFYEYDDLLLNNDKNVDKDKVEKFCTDRLKYFHVSGSKSLELFYILCTKPKKVVDIIGKDVEYLSTSGSEDDNLWSQRVKEYETAYPGMRPASIFGTPMDNYLSNVSIVDFKDSCKKSLNEEILTNTWALLVSETRRWCSR